jgi:asparagine synthase (glutamine-hydrolysing)
MSVQFGRWSFSGSPAAPGYIEKASQRLAPYGPDGGGFYSAPGVDIIYRAFHTTKESRLEQQPQQLPSGAILTWDGRLDNRKELISQLSGEVSTKSADVSIVGAVYERWGANSFARLIGDWALSIWNRGEQSLILAKDPIGTRHLYYSVDRDQVSWSSILDPLIVLAGKNLLLEEEYIAGWLSSHPASHLTPYVGICSALPACFVQISAGKQLIQKYWDFDPERRIDYRSDVKYEEHFRAVFAESVRRRLRSDTPTLAELSGGMDSCSIVCMADALIGRGAAETPRLDTISYYDDSEPSWNEQPYFERVEGKRGRIGYHIDVGTEDVIHLQFGNIEFAVTPSALGRGTKAKRERAHCMTSQGNRVVLSGIGGDEILGGVPTPMPELSDLLARARLRKLVHQLKVWALTKRQPWFHLFFQTARRFFPPVLPGIRKQMRAAPWLEPGFVKRHRAALAGYPRRLSLFGTLPSFLENLSTLEGLRRQLSSTTLPSEPPHEKAYPYLDRDLLEFVFAIPREQLVRPWQRRSLMRRSLIGIVPDEILNRKRKAFVARLPRAVVIANSALLTEMAQQLSSASLGIVDPQRILESLETVRCDPNFPIVTFMRTWGIEFWLRGMSERGTWSEVVAPRVDILSSPKRLRRERRSVADIRRVTQF